MAWGGSFWQKLASLETNGVDGTPAESNPVEKIWEWLGTPEKAKMWQTNVSATETIHETPDMVGTTFRETIEEDGRSTVMNGTVTGYAENRLLSMHLEGDYNVVAFTASETLTQTVTALAEGYTSTVPFDFTAAP